MPSSKSDSIQILAKSDREKLHTIRRFQKQQRMKGIIMSSLKVHASQNTTDIFYGDQFEKHMCLKT